MAARGAGRSRRQRSGRASRELERALAELAKGSIVEAERLARSVLAADAGNADALHCLALAQVRMGRPADALESMAAAVRARPDDASLRNNHGNMLREAGRLEEAIASYRAAVEIAPEHPNALFNLAIALQRTGRLAEACVALERLARLAPADREVWARLGRTLRALGRSAEALPALARAHELDPRDGALAASVAGARVQAGEREVGRAALEALVRERPAVAMARVELADVLWSGGERTAAWEMASGAVAAEPDLGAAHRALGVIERERGRYELAARCFERCLELDPADVGAIVDLARVRITEGGLEAGAALAREAAALAPGAPEPHCLLAAVRLDLGEREAGAAHAADALARDERCAEAWLLCAELGRYPHGEEAALSALRGLLASDTLAPAAVSAAHFAIARILDRRDDVDGAFAAYRAGNRALIEGRDPQQEAARTERFGAMLRETFDEPFFAERAGWGVADPRPVLIVGMPRSGTTLVEQFLGAHPQVHAGGERTWVPELAEALAGAVGEAYPRAAARAAPGLVTDLAGRYLERLGALSPDASRITDKLPGNLVHLGLAALLMPGLRVIHCRRDPLDVCVSNYLQSFSGGHWYACDLGELGRTCREQERLMAHWRATLPVPVHEVRYEALVADPEQVVRETVAFCGLEWDDACLDHRGGARAVHTASNLQVREPLYRTSVGRWRRYAAHLGELRAALEP